MLMKVLFEHTSPLCGYRFDAIPCMYLSTLDVILSVASHPSTESSQFVTACLDGSVKLWDLDNCEEMNKNIISLPVEES